MEVLKNLKPYEVFRYFEEICSIPHGSGNTKQISDYLVAFAKDNKLWYRQDAMGNVIIKKPGTAGYEDSKPVIIQGHIDMVCEKDADCDIDFATEGLRLHEDGTFVFAEGTTLGGDDGIAVAFAMAILADEGTIAHPAIEAVFTVDEEIGLLGATAIDCSDLEGKLFLNLDSEEEGHLLVSCAGGATANLWIPVCYETDTHFDRAVEVRVTGATGGHSGVEINKQGANASKALGRVLHEIMKEVDIRLVSLAGGMKDNAIPREASVVLAVAEKKDIETITHLVNKYDAIFSKEFDKTDADICVLVKAVDTVCQHMTKDVTKRFVQALMLIPNGVIRMSNDIEGLVQTSLNLGILEITQKDIHFGLSVRSSVSSEKDMLLENLAVVAEAVSADFDIKGAYPAWEYKKDSYLRNVMIETYRQLYKEEPVVEAIHAGLECGLFSDKIKDLDCVSFGPWIYDIHTPKERLMIASVERTWKYVLEVLKKLK